MPDPVPDRTPATEEDHISRAANDHANEMYLQVSPQCPTWSDGRPRAEPPMYNNERFERECIASDKRLRRMFLHDPVERTEYSDVKIERELLCMLGDWV